MTVCRRLVLAWCALMLLTLVNYQVVVIVCNDFIVLKFLRDILLIYIIVQTFAQRPGICRRYLPALLLVAVFLALALLKTQGLSTMALNIRKYLFPVGVLVAARSFTCMRTRDYRCILKFTVTAVAVIAAWGVFQAYILGDQFLIDLGYPTIFSHAYQRTTLNYSYYFGNLGIQRVTGTLSNSNVFGIILGMSLLTIVLNKGWLLRSFGDWLRLGCIALGYIGTVSRSNYLAMIAVVIVLVWRYVPHKEKVFMGALAALGAFIAMYLLEDAGGLVHKLVNWVIQSLTLQEGSVAGRGGFWGEALEAIKDSPLGIGFGHTGAMGYANGGQVYECENSYLAMALDLGWLGVAAYVSLMAAVMYDAYRTWAPQGLESVKKQAVTAILYLMVVFCFSNHIYDMEAMTLVYFLAGISVCYLEIQPRAQANPK